ncbi:hypothetical protein PhCBS80983_g05074 [Powellomyces hirtus]|uniref:Peptide hydrolase n=1 Tax=Powellomyces hirtus TaxID=109895 RepID=A0A507DX39_9FUNG|nr:hypothetical protein PhCBS80983_g05074 [Powellomyces hirtus]
MLCKPFTLALLGLVAANQAIAQSWDFGLVDKLSKSLQNSITPKALYRHLSAFQAAADAGGGTRVFGSPGNQQSLDYVTNLLKQTGQYDVKLEPFEHLDSRPGPTNNTLALLDDNTKFDLKFHFYSPAADVEGDLVILPDTFVEKDGKKLASTGCNLDGFSGTDVKGKIVLIRREVDREFPCPMQNKTLNAAQAGAAGVILYPTPSGSTRPSLYEKIPSAGLYQADVDPLLKKITASTVPVKARLHVDTVNKWSKTYNIHATSRRGDANNLLHVGAHIDSVAAGPGLNDNASGSVTILEVALRIAQYPIKNKIRFSWWNAEEFGLIGAKYYVANLSQKEKNRTKLYMNFDMTASPNYILGVHDGDNSSGQNSPAVVPKGCDVIEKVLTEYFNSINQTVVDYAFSGGSDYDPFLTAGIPSGGLATGASGLKSEAHQKIFGGVAGQPHDHCYHKACDTIDNVNQRALLLNTRALAHSAVRFALGDLSKLQQGRF